MDRVEATPMPGISVEDDDRDDALNRRFGHHFRDGTVPPAVIVHCTTSFGELRKHYGLLTGVPVQALQHAIHQSWDGLQLYVGRHDTPTYVIAHEKGMVEFVLHCGPWAWVSDPDRPRLGRTVFEIYPVPFSDPMCRLLGEDISPEMWKDQGLKWSHSAVVWNYR